MCQTGQQMIELNLVSKETRKAVQKQKQQHEKTSLNTVVLKAAMAGLV